MKILPVDMRIWRATYDLSQQRAADWAGISCTSWKRFERGTHEPSDETAEVLRYVLAKPPISGVWRTREDVLQDMEEEPF